jgi:hypothetical protein
MRILPVVVLSAIGCVQMAGDLLGLPVVKAIGAALAASPQPKVFTAQNGFETYASRFFIEWRDADSAAHSVEITPENYAGVRGPYNRRNAYGAAVSYGPVLATNPKTAPMLAAVTRYSLCGDAPLVRELGLDLSQATGPVRLRLEPRRAPPADRSWQLTFEANCDE